MSEQFPEFTGLWPHAQLPGNIRVGPGCYLERRASFDRFRSERDLGLVLGSNVQVLTWTEFNIEPTGRLDVGDNSVLVGAVLMCAEHIVIGQRVIVSYNVTISDCDFHPTEPDLRRQDAVANAPGGDRSKRPKLRSAPVHIGDEAWIGIGAIILKGVRIGRGARIAAGSVVTHNVPDGGAVAGNPARSAA